MCARTSLPKLALWFAMLPPGIAAAQKPALAVQANPDPGLHGNTGAA
jgi:hypothetical protein